MSDFVQFPEEVYATAGNVFEGFRANAGFTIPNARAMMWFAQLAYEVDTSGGNATAAKIQQIHARWQFQSVTAFREHSLAFGKVFDTTGVFGRRADAFVLAFAGTDPAVLETVITDAHFRVGESNTHEGFQAAFDAVSLPKGGIPGPVAAAINQTASAPDIPLFITGHSLGAALAILAADAALKAGVTPRGVYGFGTPRVGGATFADRYNASLGERTYRMVHGRDLVTRVPMSFLKYRHVGRVLACDPGGKFAAGNLAAAPSDEPDVSASYVGQLLAMDGRNVAGTVGRLLTDQVKSLFGGGSKPNFVSRISEALQPPGFGPLGPWFRFMPPAIRDHLQDRYIAALT